MVRICPRTRQLKWICLVSCRNGWWVFSKINCYRSAVKNFGWIMSGLMLYACRIDDCSVSVSNTAVLTSIRRMHVNGKQQINAGISHDCDGISHFVPHNGTNYRAYTQWRNGLIMLGSERGLQKDFPNQVLWVYQPMMLCIMLACSYI